MEDKKDFSKKINGLFCRKHNISYSFKCPTCESKRKEKINESYEKAVKIHDKALKKLGEN